MRYDLTANENVVFTTSPWIDSVPRHWDIKPGFAVLSEKKERNTGMRESQVLSLSFGRIVVRPQERLHGLVPESFETYQIIGPRDIIIRPTDLQNDQTSLRVGFANDRGIISSAYLCLQAHGCLLPEYAYYLLHAFDLMKVYYGLGSGLRHNLSFNDFKRLPILVPPEEEQLAIVRFLNYTSHRVSRYINTKKQLISLLQEKRQSVVNNALTRGLIPGIQLKPSGIEWLGDIPAHWEIKRAKALCRAIVDCKNRTPEAIDDGDYLVVRTTCVRNGRFNPAGGYRTDKRNYLAWTERGAPRTGDVFFTREAPAGQACLVPDREDLCMGQRMMYFRPDPELLVPEFLLLNIYGPLTKPHIELATNGSTVGHLRLGQVNSLPLLWCPIEEQRAIVSHVSRATAQIDQAVEAARREVSLLKEYRNRLVVDVVTGKVDVRDTASRLPPVELSDLGDDEVEDLGLDDSALATKHHRDLERVEA